MTQHQRPLDIGPCAAASANGVPRGKVHTLDRKGFVLNIFIYKICTDWRGNIFCTFRSVLLSVASVASTMSKAARRAIFIVLVFLCFFVLKCSKNWGKVYPHSAHTPVEDLPGEESVREIHIVGSPRCMGR